MLELNRTEIPVKVYGEVFKLRPPTVGEKELFSKISNDKNEIDVINAGIELLTKLGLRDDVANALELDHMRQLLELVSESSKKK